MSNAGSSDGSTDSVSVADILTGTDSGAEERGTETGGEEGRTETTPDTSGETESGSPTTEETRRVRIEPVSPVGNPGGVSKKRIGRPPGSRNKSSKVAKPVERTGFNVPCSPEQAESCAKVILAMTTPALDGLAALCNRPALLDREKQMQHDAIVEYAIAYGDPLGKYGPLIFLCVAYSAPITQRIAPAEYTGLDKEVAAELARKEKEAEEAAKK